MIFVRCESIIFEAILRIFIGILSGPVALLGFKFFMILLISFVDALGKSKGISFIVFLY